MWTLKFKSAPSELISSQCALTFDNGKEFDHISWHKFAARLRFSGKGFIGVIWFSLFLTLSLFFFNHFRIIYQMLFCVNVVKKQVLIWEEICNSRFLSIFQLIGNVSKYLRLIDFLKKEYNSVTFVIKAQLQIQKGSIRNSFIFTYSIFFSFSGKQICLENTKKRCKYSNGNENQITVKL